MKKLMTKAIERKLPPLYSTDGQGDKAIAKAHWFCSNIDWFATEYDPQTKECFGLVKMAGNYPELGYFSITELERINDNPIRRLNDGSLVVTLVERDEYWEERTIGECRDY